MATFFDTAVLVPTLCGHLAADACVEDVHATVAVMSDTEIVAVIAEAAAAVQRLEHVKLVATGIAAARSGRETGHSGLAQTLGHRSPAALIQHLTGSSKADAARQVRVGEALVQGGVLGNLQSELQASTSGVGGGSEDDETSSESSGLGTPACALPDEPWNAPLIRAHQHDVITSAQFDTIQRNLGEPPAVIRSAGQPGADGVVPGTDVDAGGDAGSAANDGVFPGVDGGADGGAPVIDVPMSVATREAWSLAAEHLIAEAAVRCLEELGQSARTIRDYLDPDGAQARFTARYENRSLRMYRGTDGQKRATWVLDDEGEIFIDSVYNAALRPRRGGPTFVDSAEAARAKKLSDDTRTNDQLAYDLLLDVLRAGVLADTATVFGTRQAGVRLVQIIDTPRESGSGSGAGAGAGSGVGAISGSGASSFPTFAPAVPTFASIGHSEDGLISLPSSVIEQHICNTGTITVTTDRAGNPLNLGREHRLFSSPQRIALAVRDGGCRWNGCDRPASYSEAHHIDPYSTGGRTDIDRGILLCRHHHMNLHNNQWKISREGRDDFILTHRTGTSETLKPRAALHYLWGNIAIPPQRFRPAA